MIFKKEIKIAVIVTFIIVLFLWGFNFLKGRNLFSAFNYYYAVFENIDDLQKSNVVTINGFSVGIVSDIRFETDRLDRLIVEIGINKMYKIPDNSVMTISSDLLGGKSVVLLLGDSDVIAESGGSLRGEIAAGLIDTITDKLMPIADNADKLLVSVDSLLQVLHNTLDDDLQNSVQSIVANLEQMVVSERRKIAAILTNFESVSSNLQQSNDDISNLMSNLAGFSETLAASDVKSTIDNANRSMSELHVLLSGINEGEGTIGKFMRDDSLYVYLQRSADDLDKLLVDLRENPKRYVHFSLFGRKN